MWIDLTDTLTKDGAKMINVGQVLMFKFEGSETNLKIMRKRNGKVWAKEVQMYTPEQFQALNKDKVE